MRTEVSRGGGGKEVVNMGGDGAEVFLGRDLLLDVEMVEMVESGKQGGRAPSRLVPSYPTHNAGRRT